MSWRSQCFKGRGGASENTYLSFHQRHVSSGVKPSLVEVTTGPTGRDPTTERSTKTLQPRGRRRREGRKRYRDQERGGWVRTPAPFLSPGGPSKGKVPGKPTVGCPHEGPSTLCLD